MTNEPGLSIFCSRHGETRGSHMCPGCIAPKVPVLHLGDADACELRASVATMSTTTDARTAAEAKVERALEVCATDEERALLVQTLLDGLDWSRDRARIVLKKAGWLL